jgi:leader peptidase (prepilin peptidase) / N-methyltransferase
MDPLLVAGCAAGGLIAGDLLEPLADRLPKKLPLDRPWFRCPSCEAPDTGSARIPVLRNLSRRRPCGSCGDSRPHALRPAIQGVLSAAVLAGLAVRFGPNLALAAYAVIGLALVAISIIDIETRMVPNRILYPAAFVAAPLLVAAAAVDHRWTSLWHAAACAAIGFVALFLVHFAYPKGMGFGDVRLAGLVGGAAGWMGFRAAFVAFFLMFLLGSIGGIIQLAVTGGGRRTAIGFAPYMAAGTLVVVIFTMPIFHLLHPVLYRSGS